MAAETIVPSALDAHAPKKSFSSSLWKYLSFSLIATTVAGATFAVVFANNARSLKEELAEVTSQRTQVEDRLSLLVTANQDLENYLIPHYYIRRSPDVKTHSLIAVDPLTQEEKVLYKTEEWINLYSIPRNEKNALYLSVQGDNDTGNARIYRFNTETATLTSLDIFTGKETSGISPDGAWVASVQSGTMTFSELATNTSKQGAVLLPNEYFYEKMETIEGGVFSFASGYQLHWLDANCVTAAIYTSTEVEGKNSFKEWRMFCHE